VLGPTDPNRLMLMSASIDPEGTNGGPVVQTFSDPLSAYNTLSWETMPQRLLAAGVKPSSHTISDRTSDHRTGGRQTEAPPLLPPRGLPLPLFVLVSWTVGRQQCRLSGVWCGSCALGLVRVGLFSRDSPAWSAERYSAGASTPLTPRA
jgi:hypothetical protein